jgi:hypothetical protein
MEAEILETHEQAAYASPGIYVVTSGSGAYWPVMGYIANGLAEFLGAVYDQRGRTVVARLTSNPPVDGRMSKAEEPERRTITIGAQFFVTALKDYENWPLKWWREVVQNAVDAGATMVNLSSEVLADNSVRVVCDDDGSGMDADTVVNKFLVLGASSKTSATGAAGGFGKAKELILLPWISWKIHTRDVLIEGMGIDYTVQRTEARKGTRLEVVMPADKFTDAAIAREFVTRCYLPHVHFTINGETVRAKMIGTQQVGTVPDKAEITYLPTPDETHNYIYVRTKGLFMFERYISQIPGWVLVDLTAPSIDVLTANRDGFRDYELRTAIDGFAEKLAKDNISALKDKKGLIKKKFEGSGKFKAKEKEAEMLDQVGPTDKGILPQQSLEFLAKMTGDREEITRIMLDQRFLGPDHIEAAIRQLAWEPDFYVINEIEGYRVSKKFFPETMTPTVLKLAKTWAELCRYVMMQLGSDKRFGVGFVFSRDAGAQAITETENEDGSSRRRYNYEYWLMINPHKDMRGTPTATSEIWRPAQEADLQWLYAAAIHEATHIADGIDYHDESFAAAMTRNMAKCANGYRKIRQIAASIRSREETGKSPVSDDDEMPRPKAPAPSPEPPSKPAPRDPNNPDAEPLYTVVGIDRYGSIFRMWGPMFEPDAIDLKVNYLESQAGKIGEGQTFRIEPAPTGALWRGRKEWR